MSNFSQSLSSTNLGTTTVNIPTTDVYSIVGRLTLPTTDGSATTGPGGGAGTGTGAPPRAPSQVVVTVNQNGTPVLTTVAGTRGFSIPALSCTAGDVITCVTSSSLPSDQQSNVIRLTLSVAEGPL